MGIIAWDCMRIFLGARSLNQLVTVDPKSVEVIVALSVVQFSKEVGFFELIFE